MDFKIFKVKGKPDVLAYKSMDDNGNYEVILKSFFPDKEDKTNEYFHEESITFEGQKEPAERFIKDLSQEAVEEFSNRFSY